jgi:hypothetical protein
VDHIGPNFGNFTAQEIIIGAVRRYLANGETNSGRAPDPTDQKTIDDTYNTDITTPGLIRLPIYSAKTAYQT